MDDYMQEASALAASAIARVQRLSWHDIVYIVPDDLHMQGRADFTFRIEDQIAHCRVLAENSAEALDRVRNFFHQQA